MITPPTKFSYPPEYEGPTYQNNSAQFEDELTAWYQKPENTTERKKRLNIAIKLIEESYAYERKLAEKKNQNHTIQTAPDQTKEQNLNVQESLINRHSCPPTEKKRYSDPMIEPHSSKECKEIILQSHQSGNNSSFQKKK